MKVEIIAVGNEIITGKTVNTNASYMAKALQKIGFTPLYHTAVGDYKEAIHTALEHALKRADIILMSGGLGPTPDDLTKEAVCEYLNQPLIFDQDIYETIKSYFKRANRTLSENNKKQAYFPKNCNIIPNSNGTAPGCILKKDNVVIILLPGPPNELIPMFEETVLPYFKKDTQGEYIVLDVNFFGIGESQLVSKLEDVIGESQNLSVAPYVGDYEVSIRIVAFDEVLEKAKLEVEKIRNILIERLEEYIIGYNDSRLENTVVQLLMERSYTISIAESCTGGLLSGTLVNCSGVSSLFAEGIITYSNAAKEKYLGVKPETLSTFGAVSEQTAKEMAEGIKRVAHTTIGMATTGVAGPGGGSLEKPVGLVYIAIAMQDKTYVYKLLLQGTRQAIREKTVKHILYELYKQLR